MNDDVQTSPEVTEAAPAQQKVVLTCPKHGDVTTTALLLNFPVGDKPTQFIYCLPCLNEVLLSLQKEGAIQTLQVQVFNADGTPQVPPAPEAPPTDPTIEAVKKIAPSLISSAEAPKV